jgi:hypothetical protein
LLHVLSDDVGAGLTEPEGQQVADLDNCPLEDSSLVLLFLCWSASLGRLALVLVYEGHWSSLIDIVGGGNQRVLGNEPDLLDHPL